MASKYGVVFSSIWSKERRGWSDRRRVLALYLLTCKHRNTEGLFSLPLGYVVTDIGWDAEGVEAELAGLEGEGFCVYDRVNEVVWLCNALAWNPPKGAKRVAGAVNAVSEFAGIPLYHLFHESAAEHCPELAKALPEPVGEPPPDTLSIPYRGGIDTRTNRSGRVSITQSHSQPHSQSQPQSLDDSTGGGGSDSEDVTPPPPDPGEPENLRRTRRGQFWQQEWQRVFGVPLAGGQAPSVMVSLEEDFGESVVAEEMAGEMKRIAGSGSRPKLDNVKRRVEDRANGDPWQCSPAKEYGSTRSDTDPLAGFEVVK